MVMLFWKHSSGTQSRSRQFLAFSPYPFKAPRIWSWMGDKSKIFYLFNIREIKVVEVGVEREKETVMSCHTQSSSQTQKRPLFYLFPVLCLVSSFVSNMYAPWSSKPRTTFNHNHSFTNPRKVPCGERLSFALARGIMTLRTSPWCKWKTPAL